MRLVIFVALLGTACAASAQLYRWTDERGRVHLTDTPPPPGAKGVQSRPSSGYGTAAGAPVPFALQRAMKDSPVTLYTAPDCAPCGEARALLNARGVPFREISVVDEKQAEELQRVAGGLSVPTVRVGTGVQRGFEQSAYHAMLDAAGYPAPGMVPPRSQAEPKPQPPAPPAAIAQEEAVVEAPAETPDAALGDTGGEAEPATVDTTGTPGPYLPR